MTESHFKAEVRLDFSKRYRGRGWMAPNDTGYEQSHHDPFGGPGAGDLIGHLCGRYFEIELKAKRGKLRDLQIVHRDLIRSTGGMYIEARTLDEVHRALDAIDQPNRSVDKI